MKKCEVCSFTPVTDEDKAKSLMLSLGYEIEGDYRGHTLDELKKIGIDIRNGKRYSFSKEQIEEVIAYANFVRQIPLRQLVFDGIRWIAPPILILLIVYLLLKFS